MSTERSVYNPTCYYPIRVGPIQVGGILRCCVEEIQKDLTLAGEGDVRQCQWCSGQCRLEAGIWTWVDDVYGDI